MPIYNNKPMNLWAILLILSSSIFFVIEFLSLVEKSFISSQVNSYKIFKLDFWNFVDWANSIVGIVVGVCYTFSLLDNTNIRVLVG